MHQILQGENPEQIAKVTKGWDIKQTDIKQTDIKQTDSKQTESKRLAKGSQKTNSMI